MKWDETMKEKDKDGKLRPWSVAESTAADEK